MTQKTTTLSTDFRRARAAGAPFVAIETPDPAATVELLAGIDREAPMIQWDLSRGAVAVNDKGATAILAACNGESPEDVTKSPAEFLSLVAPLLPEDSIIFLHGAQRLWEGSDPIQTLTIVQAAWNLRDDYKRTNRTLVFLSPLFTLPSELASDTLILDEPLPNDTELARIVDQTFVDAQRLSEIPSPSEEQRQRAVDALRGLAMFPAEQVAAMSMRKAGIDLDAMWERKRKMVEATPGLSVWRDGDSFDQIGGCDNVKYFLRKVINGRNAPRVIVFIDEIEKAMGGAGSDTSGVSQGFLGTTLTYMQDKNATGSIFIGPPGAAKTAIAKAVGNEAGIPTIALDLGGMKGSLVGESEARLRTALKVISAVGSDRALFIATCNSISSLPPELRRRFTLGTFFFDLPTREERQAIWEIYSRKFEIGLDGFSGDEAWTGAEIRQCCQLAYNLRMPVADAAQFIVPVAKSAADQIRLLRSQAAGKFLSASYPGTYQYQEKAATPSVPGRRLAGVED